MKFIRNLVKIKFQTVINFFLNYAQLLFLIPGIITNETLRYTFLNLKYEILFEKF